MADYDIVIIGSGPAAISAAITASIRKKNILLLSDGISEKITKAHMINNYPGFPEISGTDLAKAMSNHLDKLNIHFTSSRANMIYNLGKSYAVQSGQTMYTTKAVIIATGVISQKTFPGENENLGKGVSYCATCDAALYPGKSAIVISYSKKEESEANFLAEYAEQVTYIPMYKEETDLDNKIIVENVSPEEIILGKDKKMILKTKEGQLTANGIFILREAIAPSTLFPDLELDGAHIKVDRNMATNLPGIFACGDVVGLPYQYIKAAGEGNVAALSAVSYLTTKK